MLSASPLTILAAANPTDHVVRHPLFGLEYFSNHQLLGLVIVVLVFVSFAHLAKRITPAGNRAEDFVTKGRFAQVLEVICEYIRDKVAKPNLGPLADKYIYYIWTVFFFILFANLLGMVPLGAILGLIDKDLQHIGGTPTTNIMVTGALAIITLFMIVYVGLKENGMDFIKHFAPIPLKGPMMLIGLPLIFLEVFGVFVKCGVLAVRLFGNLMAGHLVVAALLGLVVSFDAMSTQVPVGIGVVLGLAALSMLELFVAFLQAFIFTMLTVLFIAAGAVHHDEGHHDDHGHGHDEDYTMAPADAAVGIG